MADVQCRRLRVSCRQVPRHGTLATCADRECHWKIPSDYVTRAMDDAAVSLPRRCDIRVAGRARRDGPRAPFSRVQAGLRCSAPAGAAGTPGRIGCGWPRGLDRRGSATRDLTRRCWSVFRWDHSREVSSCHLSNRPTTPPARPPRNECCPAGRPRSFAGYAAAFRRCLHQSCVRSTHGLCRRHAPYHPRVGR